MESIVSDYALQTMIHGGLSTPQTGLYHYDSKAGHKKWPMSSTL